jgi:hypothetical protein
VSAKEIRDKITGYTRNRQQMRLANRYLSRGNDAGLREMGFTGEQIVKLKEPDLHGKIGFHPDLIRRATQRIYELKKQLAERSKSNG